MGYANSSFPEIEQMITIKKESSLPLGMPEPKSAS